MKEYYSIPLEDEEAQALLDISRLMDDKPVKSIPFPGDIDSALDEVDFGATFWYEDYHVVGLCFLSSKLNKFPESIGNLSYLRFIFIEETPIKFISTTFKELHELEQFILINDPEMNSTVILDFPDIFGFLNKLRLFYIDGNFNIFIPPSFTELKNLEELYLETCIFFTNRSYFLKHTNNKISISPDDFDPESINELPKDLHLLTSLRKITLKNLNIEKLPDTLIHLESLIEIDLSHSTSLNKIDRSQSSIKNIEIIFQIDTLEKLNLAYCELDTVPKTISNLKNLKKLNLAHNNLNKIPLEIIKCQQLRKINLTWNGFKKELTFLSSLPNLKKIIFDEAYPEIIPKELYKKKNIEIKGI